MIRLGSHRALRRPLDSMCSFPQRQAIFCLLYAAFFVCNFMCVCETLSLDLLLRLQLLSCSLCLRLMHTLSLQTANVTLGYATCLLPISVFVSV